MNERPPPQSSGGNGNGNDPASRKSPSADNGTSRSEPKKSNRLRRSTTEIRPPLIGTVVIPHTCNAAQCVTRGGSENEGCVCGLIGQRVKIADRQASDARGRACYSIEGSDKVLRSDEFEEAPAQAVEQPQAREQSVQVVT